MNNMSDKNKAQLVLRKPQPWRRRFLLGVVLIGLALLAWLSFDFGRDYTGYAGQRFERERQYWSEEKQQLELELQAAQRQVVQLESAKQVDQHATQQLRATLDEQQSQNQELREELQFYRGIVSPKQRRPGLHIHNIKIHEGESTGLYHYNLTLIHIQGLQKHHRRADGVVHLSVNGEQKGESKTLTYADVAVKKKAKLNFSFKYFSRFEGEMQLPKDFRPQQLMIKVVPKSRAIKGDEKTIAWPVG